MISKIQETGQERRGALQEGVARLPPLCCATGPCTAPQHAARKEGDICPRAAVPEAGSRPAAGPDSAAPGFPGRPYPLLSTELSKMNVLPAEDKLASAICFDRFVSVSFLSGRGRSRTVSG